MTSVPSRTFRTDRARVWRAKGISSADPDLRLAGGSGSETVVSERCASTWTRRQFLVRAGVAAALAEVPGLLALSKWSLAHAESPDLVRESLNALVAFVLPGDDPFSVAQGVTAPGPGGVAGGAVDGVIDVLDHVIPVPDNAGANNLAIPLSPAVAGLLDTVALVVNPLASLTGGGPSLAPFARLSFADKAKVLQLLEGLELPDVVLPEPLTKVSGNLNYLFGILPSLVGFISFGESSVFDSGSRSLRSRPVGWQISNHRPDGPTDGWPELKGYWQGRRKASA